ncbi:MAG: cupredoxin domain-containing protein [Chthoniobacterales bacterium]
MSHPTLQRERQGVDYGDESDVQSLHAAIDREEGDWRVTIKPFSLWVLVVFGLAFFFAGFWSARNGTHFVATSVESGNPPPSQATLQAAQPGAASASDVQSTVANVNAPAVMHVVMKNMKFDPSKLEIHRGDTVEWKNDDITPHTATAIPLFDSGSIASDQSWRHTFTEAGDFPYTCTFHPDMKGTVIVE